MAATRRNRSGEDGVDALVSLSTLFPPTNSEWMDTMGGYYHTVVLQVEPYTSLLLYEAAGNAAGRGGTEHP